MKTDGKIQNEEREKFKHRGGNILLYCAMYQKYVQIYFQNKQIEKPQIIITNKLCI